ncbi:hypothetical protein HMPREF0058_2218 [Actinomyces urogenitalis DSM 15434]|uniref:Uncharacterized protein n=1 Tax=Actinomyces urogenitalis DSM 15434 TaxID=525246 RepID=C0W8M4_9ACTO|nr:hypothetical protein HMPREF0058_2218 [Actinomyces urogenitalis DSM 15434]
MTGRHRCSGCRSYPAQALGRLPWFALDFARERRLRPRLLIVASSSLDCPTGH